MSALTRAEHLQWCKDRALEYADQGDTGNAIGWLMQDLALHSGTRDSCDVVVNLMMPLAMMGDFRCPGELRRFIEGFG